MTRTAIFAHRGVSSLYPENTMAAFQAAADLGIEGVELDIQLSKDDVPVVIHDLTLKRTTNGTGNVKDYTAQELKQFSAGINFDQKFEKETIPTLAEVLEFAKTNELIFNIELKGTVWVREEMVTSVLELIEAHQLEQRVVISAFDHKLLKMVAERAPHIETAILIANVLHEPENYMKTVGAIGYHYRTPSLLEEEVKHLNAAGVQLRPYTVNDEAWIQRYFEWECSGIVTDYPQVALALRQQMDVK